ncbi:MAG TPA: PIN domain-containing protein [Mycobacteriales bacterium]
MARVVLDAGAVLGAAHGSQRARAAIRVARERGDDLVVPAVVVAEVVRGKTSTDVNVDRALKGLRQVPSTPRKGRVAGQLLTGLTGPSTVDALVMAEALLSGGAAVVVTTDRADMNALLASAAGIPRLRSSAARVTVLAV